MCWQQKHLFYFSVIADTSEDLKDRLLEHYYTIAIEQLLVFKKRPSSLGKDTAAVMDWWQEKRHLLKSASFHTEGKHTFTIYWQEISDQRWFEKAWGNHRKTMDEQ